MANISVTTESALIHLNENTTNKGGTVVMNNEDYDMLMQASWIIGALTVLAIAYFVIRAIRLRRKIQHHSSVGIRKERASGRRDRVEMQHLTNEQMSDEDDTTLFDSSVVHHR